MSSSQYAVNSMLRAPYIVCSFQWILNVLGQYFLVCLYCYVMHCSNVFLSVRLSDPPAVEPVWQEVRQGLGRPVSMNCRVLRAHPSRVLRYEWRLGSRLLHAGTFDSRDDTDYSVRSLAREGYGEYTCDVINEVGPGRCTFLVTGETPPTLHHMTQGLMMTDSCFTERW